MRREYRERFPRHRLQRKPLVSDPGMHHSTCVTGSLTRSGGKNVPGIPSACATRNFTYLVRGPCSIFKFNEKLRRTLHFPWYLHGASSLYFHMLKAWHGNTFQHYRSFVPVDLTFTKTVMLSLDGFFSVVLFQLLNKQPIFRWFETP